MRFWVTRWMAWGNPINGEELGLVEEYPVEATPPDPMSRDYKSSITTWSQGS